MFAIEVAVRTGLTDPFGERARQLVTGLPKRPTAADKQRQYRDLSELVLERIEVVDYGCWDYFDEHRRALIDFDMWRSGMLTQEGARETPSTRAGESTDEPRYLTLTLVALMRNDSPTDMRISDACQIPEDSLWNRDVMGAMLEVVQTVDFADVVRDVVYTIPNDPHYALTPTDLSEPKFDYLRRLG